jgi:hypothetical protein
MTWIVGNHRKAEAMQVSQGNSGFESTIEPIPNGNRFRLLTSLIGTIFIFTLLYGSSYLALLWLPADEGMDMRSQLAVDYRPWSVLAFQPVDPAIIDEIRQERGLPEQIATDGLFWPTPTNTLSVPTPGTDTTASTSQVTSDHLPSSPTAFPPVASSTSMPASTTVLPPISTVTPQPTGAANPTGPQRNPKKTKTPKPPKPPKNP